MPKPCTTLYFVRHGQSIANTQSLVTGDENDALTGEGKKQAEIIGHACQKIFHQHKIEFDQVWISNFKRAQETANTAFPALPLNIDSRLNETNAGSVKNWKLNHFIEKYPDFYSQFNPSMPYPDGESHADLAIRVQSWVESNLIKNMKKNILVVAHNGTLAAILHNLFNIPLSLFPVYRAPHATLSMIELHESREQHVPHIKCLGICDALNLP